MRRFAALVFGTLLTGVGSAAEPNCSVPNMPNVPTANCGCAPDYGRPCRCGNPQCTDCRTCQPNCTTPGQPRDMPPSQPTPRPGPSESPPVTRETGFYQAPPRSGAFEGASRSAGVNFGGITIPEIRLRMPSIELPSITRIRQGAKMRMDSSVAPWVSTGYETVGGQRAVASAADTRGAANNNNAEPRGNDAKSRGTEDCEEVKREYENKLRDLQRKIDDCDKLKRCIQDCLDEQAKISARNQTQFYTQMRDPSSPTPLPPTTPRTSPPQPPPDDVRVPSPRELRPASYYSTAHDIEDGYNIQRIAPAPRINNPASYTLERLPSP